MYDIAIIGLGPAGATLARLLDPSLRVIAIDKKEGAGQAGFHKPCGGLLAPDAQKILSRFDLSLPLDVLVSPQIFNVRTIDLASGIVRHYQRAYLNLDRHRFDQWLMAMIPSTVDIRHGAVCRRITKTDGGYQVEFLQDGRQNTITARYLVGADGANSKVRRYLYPNADIRTYLSIQQWFADTHATPFYSCVFDSRATDCYAWGLAKNQYFIFGGAFAVHGGRERFAQLKTRLRDFGFSLDQPVKTEACLVLRPSGVRDLYCGKDGAFLVGEAAGLISPSSLEGISYAFQSAYELSKVLARRQERPNRAYLQKMLAVKAKLLLKNLKSPFLYHPVLRRMVMTSGVGSVVMAENPPPKKTESSL